MYRLRTLLRADEVLPKMSDELAAPLTREPSADGV
jgi:hypothetical protein